MPPLQQSADESVELLQKLKESAARSRSWHTTASTLNLLQRVHHDISDSLRNLQTWVAQFKKGKQTTDEEVIRAVHQLFTSLGLHIDAVDTALDSRLWHRKFFSIGILNKKKLV